ncbi:class I SAM-dependent methyltransferase [Janibacter sp. DB-40]|uniref:class I SAM-dependent methyltransferase n=1 Tax=Janibacter sp. DB-40 TaxID=3028808 RepID=UPI002405B088|nr:class I SAM-dependent methyltransferase [Janibacter sp. DB-40]
MDDYLAINRANWDDRTAIHVDSPEYDLARYRSDPQSISDVVSFDRPRLGDLDGLRAVHLQCHIGTDTLSLHRLGAQVIGVDLSPAAVTAARELARETGAEIDYVVSDVYRAPEALAGVAPFDLVYTGIGALNWLPDIDRWAGVVASLLRPGGRLHLREGHPMLWSLDDPREDRLLAVEYPYFQTEAPMVWDEASTYVSTGEGSDGRIGATVTHEWNHGLGEIVTALLDHGMRITGLEEHDSVPYLALGDQMEPHPDHPGEFRLTERRERLAASYTLQAVKEH